MEEKIENNKKKIKKLIGFFLLTLPAGLSQFACIYIFETLLKLEYYQAFAIGFAFATTWNFTVNRKKTFGDSINYKKATPFIVLFYLIFVTFAISFAYVWGNFIPWGNFKQLSSYLGTLIIMIANFVSTYLLCGKITKKFKKEQSNNTKDSTNPGVTSKIEENEDSNNLGVISKIEENEDSTSLDSSDLNKEKHKQYTPKRNGLLAKIVYGFMKNLVVGKYDFIYHDKKPDVPSVFIANHTRIKGPLAIQYRYPGHVRTWSNAKFIDKKESYYHFKDNVIKNIKGEKIYKLLLPIAVPIVNWYYKTQLNCIPVYTDMKITQTFQSSIETLKNGVNVAIYPEVKETVKNEVIGFFKSGFAFLGYHYHKQTENLLEFYPIYIAQTLRQVHFGKPVSYDPNIPIKQQSENIKNYLETSVTELARSLPTHKMIAIYGEYKVHEDHLVENNSSEIEKD